MFVKDTLNKGKKTIPVKIFQQKYLHNLIFLNGVVTILCLSLSLPGTSATVREFCSHMAERISKLALFCVSYQDTNPVISGLQSCHIRTPFFRPHLTLINPIRGLHWWLSGKRIHLPTCEMQV